MYSALLGEVFYEPSRAEFPCAKEHLVSVLWSSGISIGKMHDIINKFAMVGRFWATSGKKP